MGNSCVYIAVQKDIGNFNLYKSLWEKRGKTGIMVRSVAEAIEKIRQMQTSKTGQLYFISIVSDDIAFMADLTRLCEEAEKAKVPVLIATSPSNYCAKEHFDSLAKGAILHDKFFDDPELNVDCVEAAVNGYNQRQAKELPPSDVISYGGIILYPLTSNVSVNEKDIRLNKLEFNVLRYLMKNRGMVRTYEQIYDGVWGAEEYVDDFKIAVQSSIGRLRKALMTASGGRDYIETYRGVGYRFPKLEQ